jgi:NAD(P)-dependent dehydrogenase (short-subunit alcohol dehydrogenase family)
VASALITGGTGGLGSAVIDALLADGWRCVVPWVVQREADRVREHHGEALEQGRLVLAQADLFDAAAVASVVATAEGESEPLGALVNLVGGYAAPGKVDQTDVSEFEEQMRLNLRATYLACSAALPHLLERKDGAIVCVSSRAALRPFAGASGYVAAKAAVLAFVDAMSVEYVRMGVRTNAILPSTIDTPANRASMPDADHSRWVEPAEIARVIAFLVGPDSRPISGAHIPVYGQA